MNEHHSAGENQETGAEPSSQPRKNAGTGNAGSSQSGSPKSREERLSEINQYVTLVSSILSILSPSVLAVTVAFGSNLNDYVFGIVFGIFLVVLLATSFSFIVSWKAIRKKNKLSTQTGDIAFEGDSTEAEVNIVRKDIASRDEDIVFREKYMALWEKDIDLRERDIALREKDIDLPK